MNNQNKDFSYLRNDSKKSMKETFEKEQIDNINEELRKCLENLFNKIIK